MVRQILGISGGKDSAALAIYLKNKYPELKIEYYNSDTGCELDETNTLVNRLDSYLGGITVLRALKVVLSQLLLNISLRQVVISYHLLKHVGVHRR